MDDDRLVADDETEFYGTGAIPFVVDDDDLRRILIQNANARTDPIELVAVPTRTSYTIFDDRSGRRASNDAIVFTSGVLFEENPSFSSNCPILFLIPLTGVPQKYAVENSAGRPGM